MNDGKRVTVTIEREGRCEPPLDDLSLDEFTKLLKGMSGQRDTTISVQQDGLDEQLLIAVDRMQAFIGLERPDGLFQFAQRGVGSTTTPFTIGGQEADIESRYLVGLDTAASVAREWTTAGEESSLGIWERQ